MPTRAPPLLPTYGNGGGGLYSYGTKRTKRRSQLATRLAIVLVATSLLGYGIFALFYVRKASDAIHEIAPARGSEDEEAQQGGGALEGVGFAEQHDYGSRRRRYHFEEDNMEAVNKAHPDLAEFNRQHQRLETDMQQYEHTHFGSLNADAGHGSVTSDLNSHTLDQAHQEHHGALHEAISEIHHPQQQQAKEFVGVEQAHITVPTHAPGSEASPAVHTATTSSPAAGLPSPAVTATTLTVEPTAQRSTAQAPQLSTTTTTSPVLVSGQQESGSGPSPAVVPGQQQGEATQAVDGEAAGHHHDTAVTQGARSDLATDHTTAATAQGSVSPSPVQQQQQGGQGQSVTTSSTSSQAPKAVGLYALSAKDIHGVEQPLSQYAGNVTLVVNVASACGYTDVNYKGLQKTYEKYRTSGFVVLAFPCNQFGAQEPGDEATIQHFCSTTYHTTFPLYAKVDVNGPNTHPVFKFLKQYLPVSEGGGGGTGPGQDFGWNFYKVLVDPYGLPIKRFDSQYDIGKVEHAIYNALEARHLR